MLGAMEANSAKSCPVCGREPAQDLSGRDLRCAHCLNFKVVAMNPDGTLVVEAAAWEENVGRLLKLLGTYESTYSRWLSALTERSRSKASQS